MKQKTYIGKIAVVLIVIIIFFVSSRESNVEIGQSSLTLTGVYGKTVIYSEITNMEIRDSIPRTTRRINGIGLAGIRKGYFAIDEFDKARLLVHSSQGPFIVLETASEVIIANFKDANKTQQIFGELQKAIKN